MNTLPEVIMETEQDKKRIKAKRKVKKLAKDKLKTAAGVVIAKGNS